MKGEPMLKNGSTDRGLRRWRAVALLTAGLAIGVTMMATPAASHVGGTVSHLWNQHIKPRADARYANAVVGTDKAKRAANSDALNGRAANALVRSARVNTGATTAIPSGTTTTYGTPLSITAPTAGFVVVNGSVSVQNAGCATSCVIWTNIRHIQSGELSTSIVTAVTDAFEATSNSWVFPVNAGVNTFDVRITRNDGETGGINGWFAEMNATFVPFGATGGATITALRPAAKAAGG
jgi:hypothetical protein